MKSTTISAFLGVLLLTAFCFYWIARQRMTPFQPLQCRPQENKLEEPLAAGSCDWALSYNSPACVAASAAALRRLGSEIHEVTATCVLRDTGKRGGNHMLCDVLPLPNDPCCSWLSVGVAHDYSFDQQLHDRYPTCTGHLLDPSVSYASRMDDRLFFYPIGLQTKLPHDNMWVLTSMPMLFQLFVGEHERLSILKIDCEGCEYAIAEHVAAEFPRLFARVDQLAIEVHLAKKWWRDEHDAFHLGMLLEMLHREGLILQHVERDACGEVDEMSGCADTPLFCAPKAMCHNYLFARAGL